MSRPAELFAVAATVLLLMRWLDTIFTTPISISIKLGDALYAFPPESAWLIMATFLCFYAAVYSVWILPMNRTAALWHFWATIISIALFWLCFYGHGFLPSGRVGDTIIMAWIVSQLVLLLAQFIFAVNLVAAIVKLHNSPLS